MKLQSRHILFLNSRYRATDNAFYLELLNDGYQIAVDGGIQFFLKNNLRPDVLIGDFDSAPRLSKKYLSGIEVLRYPSKKNKTDSQLAIELALERGAESIILCGGLGSSEIDHTMGNIFLLDLINRFNKRHGKKCVARLISPKSSVYLMHNDSIVLNSKVGNFLSIIPISESVALDFSGLVYPPPKKRLKFGDTLSLRNRFKGRRCQLKVGGKAIVVVISDS